MLGEVDRVHHLGGLSAAADDLVVDALSFGVIHPLLDPGMGWCCRHRHREYRSHASPYDEGVVDIDRMARDDNSLSAEGVRRTD